MVLRAFMFFAAFGILWFSQSPSQVREIASETKLMPVYDASYKQ